MLVEQEKQAAFGMTAPARSLNEVGNPLAAISTLVQLLNRRNVKTKYEEAVAGRRSTAPHPADIA